MKVTVKGFIAVSPRPWMDSGFKYSVSWYNEGMEKYLTEDQLKLCEYDIEIEAPDNLDDLIRDNTLQALQEKRKITLAENQQRINEIDRQIGELMAIEDKS